MHRHTLPRILRLVLTQDIGETEVISNQVPEANHSAHTHGSAFITHACNHSHTRIVDERAELPLDDSSFKRDILPNAAVKSHTRIATRRLWSIHTSGSPEYPVATVVPYGHSASLQCMETCMAARSRRANIRICNNTVCRSAAEPGREKMQGALAGRALPRYSLFHAAAREFLRPDRRPARVRPIRLRALLLRTAGLGGGGLWRGYRCGGGHGLRRPSGDGPWLPRGATGDRGDVVLVGLRLMLHHDGGHHLRGHARGVRADWNHVAMGHHSCIDMHPDPRPVHNCGVAACSAKRQGLCWLPRHVRQQGNRARECRASA